MQKLFKNIFLDRSICGPDASFSINEQEFTNMVMAVWEAENTIGIVDYNLAKKHAKGKNFARSLYVVKDIKAGEVITEENVRIIRPEIGLYPKELKNWFSKTSPIDFEKGDRFLI